MRAVTARAAVAPAVGAVARVEGMWARAAVVRGAVVPMARVEVVCA
jgi:hypothetical protein